MEEKLSRILEDYSEKLERYEKKEQTLNFKIEYYDKHNLNEEKRIALVELNAMDRVVWTLRKMYNEVKEVADKWNT